MPVKAARVCTFPGCTQLVRGTPRCSRHPYDKAHRKGRQASSAQRGYGYAWQKIRAAFLRRNPTCVSPGCGERARHADHITPRALGGTNDVSNLQALCPSCHSRKTASRDGGFGNRRKT